MNIAGTVFVQARLILGKCIVEIRPEFHVGVEGGTRSVTVCPCESVNKTNLETQAD